MSWRRAHGTAASLGRLVVSECPPLAALPPPAAEVPASRDRAGRFTKGNVEARKSKLRVGPMGALAALEAKADPAYRQCLAYGRRYAVQRRRELALAHGELSTGVGTLIESAGQLLAASRYFQARGAADGNADHVRLAAQLTAQARGAERDAFELASREATARRETRPANALAALLAAPAPSDDEQEPTAPEPAPEAT
jgi:hypothetical protein